MTRWRARIRGQSPVPPLTITGSPAASGVVGEFYSFYPQFGGGKGQLVLSVDGELPPSVVLVENGIEGTLE